MGVTLQDIVEFLLDDVPLPLAAVHHACSRVRYTADPFALSRLVRPICSSKANPKDFIGFPMVLHFLVPRVCGESALSVSL